MRFLSFSTPARSMAARAAIALIPAILATTHMTAQAIEEPDHQVLRQIEGVELRQYAAYTVAEVVVPGPAADAGGQAFPILAGYIFGKNKGERKLEMTAPVTQTAVPVKLDMTAPVTQTATPGGFLVQFVLPRGVTLATAPEPLDTRVRLREVPPAVVAVIRYSGFWSTSNDDEHLSKLQSTLKAADIAWTGEPVVSRYNAPFIPWFMRRNEIWLRVADSR